MKKINFTFRTERVNGENIKILSPSCRTTKDEVLKMHKEIIKIFNDTLKRSEKLFTD